jgi:hypothetical protein
LPRSDWQGEIIGAARRLELVQNRKIERRIRNVQPAPQRLSGDDDATDGVLFGADEVGDFVGNHGLYRLTGRAPPSERGAEELRMEMSGCAR